MHINKIPILSPPLKTILPQVKKSLSSGGHQVSEGLKQSVQQLGSTVSINTEKVIVNNHIHHNQVAPSDLPQEIQKVYFDAVQQKETFLNDLKEVAQEAGVEYRTDLEKYAVKSPASIKAKMDLKSIFDLTDILRGALIIKKADEYPKILAALQKRGYSLWYDFVQNRFTSSVPEHWVESSPDFKAIFMLLTKGNQDKVVKELQLMTHHAFDVKMRYENDIYKVKQAILKAKVDYGKSPILFMFEKFLNDFSNNVYEKANALDKAVTMPILPTFIKNLYTNNSQFTLSDLDTKAIKSVIAFLKNPLYDNRPIAKEIEKGLNEFLKVHGVKE